MNKILQNLNAAEKGEFKSDNSSNNEMKAILESLNSVQQTSQPEQLNEIASVAVSAESPDEVAEIIKLLQVDTEPQVTQDPAPCGTYDGPPDMPPKDTMITPKMIDSLEGDVITQEDWDNEPEEDYQDHQTMTHDLSGGINRRKKSYKRAEPGDNPMAVESSIKEELSKMLKKKMSESSRDEDDDYQDYLEYRAEARATGQEVMSYDDWSGKTSARGRAEDRYNRALQYYDLDDPAIDDFMEGTMKTKSNSTKKHGKSKRKIKESTSEMHKKLPQGETVEFNTGRYYAPEGQIIEATWIDTKSDGNIAVVAFNDKTRRIMGIVEVPVVGDVISATDVMDRYDAGGYEIPTRSEYSSLIASARSPSEVKNTFNENTNMKLVKKAKSGNRAVKIYKDTEWDEFVLKHYENGEYLKNADYFDDDKESVLDSAEYFLSRSELDEYFQFDADDFPKRKDRGPRDHGEDELARRAKLGKHPMAKHGKDLADIRKGRRKGWSGNDVYVDPRPDAYKIKGPKGRLPESELDLLELDYQSMQDDDNLQILRDAINSNQIVSVAYVKKDGTVKHMAFRKNLKAYKHSTAPKTDAQANVERNHDLKRVIDMNSYNKMLKAEKAKGLEDQEAREKAAKGAWRSINLRNVLGFSVRGQFIDLRDENEILDRFGEEVYNSLTGSMKQKLDSVQQQNENRFSNESENHNDKMAITRQSPFTGKKATMMLDVTADQIADWKSGTLIQDAFPNLSADEREFIKTGITPEDWDNMFGKLDESKRKKVNEALSEKGIANIKKIVSQSGTRDAGVKLIDYFLIKKIGMPSSFLPDTALFANGLDEIESFLEEEDYHEAFELARDTAEDMLHEEGLYEESDDEDKVLQSRPASNPLAATIDADRQTRQNRKYWTHEERAEINNLLLMMKDAYPNAFAYYENFRKNFAALKVREPSRSDRISNEAENFERLIDSIGGEKITTGRGDIIFRIPQGFTQYYDEMSDSVESEIRENIDHIDPKIKKEIFALMKKYKAGKISTKEMQEKISQLFDKETVEETPAPKNSPPKKYMDRLTRPQTHKDKKKAAKRGEQKHKDLTFESAPVFKRYVKPFLDLSPAKLIEFYDSQARPIIKRLGEERISLQKANLDTRAHDAVLAQLRENLSVLENKTRGSSKRKLKEALQQAHKVEIPVTEEARLQLKQLDGSAKVEGIYIGDVNIISTVDPSLILEIEEDATDVVDDYISLDLDLEVEYDILGRYRPATRYEPEEYPEIDEVVYVVGNGKRVYVDTDKFSSNVQGEIIEGIEEDAKDDDFDVPLDQEPPKYYDGGPY